MVIQSHVHYLNDYPFDDRDMVIEFNGLLAERRHVYMLQSGFRIPAENATCQAAWYICW